MSNELVPVTGTDLVPSTGTEVALRETLPATITDGAVVEDNAEGPKQILKAKTVDPMYMKPGEVKRLVNRLRKARFYLNMRLFVKETRFKEDLDGWGTYPMLQVTARQAMDVMTDLERRHADHWVRAHHIPADGTRYSTHFLSIG